MAEALDPRRVQTTLVGMLFDPEFAARVRAGRVAGLSPHEHAILSAIDPRALTADPYRRARAITVLLDEYPVSIALVGTAVAERFFASEAFRMMVGARGSMAVAFGAWLGRRAGGIGALEHALAQVRRPQASAAPQLVARAPNVCTRILPHGTLAYHAEARARLGDDVAARLADGRAVTLGRAPDRGSEFVLVESRPDGSIDVGTASAPLVRLLEFAGTGQPRAKVCAEAVRLGATREEADELVDDLVAQGLLTASSRG